MAEVSVLIITHGREELLSKCLGSLRELEAPFNLILIANGLKLSEEVLNLSHSLSSQVMTEFSPEKLTPGKARNLGLSLVTTPWVYLIDDDAYLIPHYGQIAGPLFQNAKVDVFGGPDAPAPKMTLFAQSLAIALSSPFCTGTTFARHRSLGNRLVAADEQKLTSCNLWIRMSALGEIRFPEDYKRGEEVLLLNQLDNSGASMFYHPKLKVGHFRRKNFWHLLRPSFDGGFYRSRILKEGKFVGAEVFWLPSVFVVLHLTYFFSPESFWEMTKIYAGTILAVSLGLSSKAGKPWLFCIVALLHYFIVTTFGLGFLYERIKFWK